MISNIKLAGIAVLGFLLLLLGLQSERLKNAKKEIKDQKRQVKQAEKVAEVKTKVSEVSVESEKVAHDEVEKAVNNSKHKRGHFTS